MCGCIVWPLLGACQGGNNTHVRVVYSELLGTLRNAGRIGCVGVWVCGMAGADVPLRAGL